MLIGLLQAALFLGIYYLYKFFRKKYDDYLIAHGKTPQKEEGSCIPEFHKKMLEDNRGNVEEITKIVDLLINMGYVEKSEKQSMICKYRD